MKINDGRESEGLGNGTSENEHKEDAGAPAS